MKKSFLSALFIMLVSTILLSQTKKIDFVEYDLDNGLHVILHKDNSTPIVAVSIMYHVGSKNEEPDRTGFAHFFEHLMFEGSKNIDRGQFDKIMEGAGAANNASTSFDRTFYYEILPSNQLDLGLWVESERLLHGKIDSIGVETQRKVVKEERSQRMDNQPYGSLLEQTFSHSYKVHPYRWTPIGSTQYIDQATIEEFVEFYKKFYVPNNAVLSIAGDIDYDIAKEKVAKYFADIPRGTIEIKKPTEVEPVKTEEVRDVVYDNITLPLVLYAYHIPGMSDPDSYSLTMLTTLLSGGESSRLNKSLVDDQQKARVTGSFPLPTEDPGLFLAYAISNVGVSADDLDKALDNEIEKVKSSPIEETEFQKLRNQVENNFISSNSRVAGIAESLADYYMFYGNTDLINSDLDKYMAVTIDDIKRVANKYLTKENRVVLHYLPKEK
jgi:predicted Zn-dependent peptidase